MYSNVVTNCDEVGNKRWWAGKSRSEMPVHLKVNTTITLPHFDYKVLKQSKDFIYSKLYGERFIKMVDSGIYIPLKYYSPATDDEYDKYCDAHVPAGQIR